MEQNKADLRHELEERLRFEQLISDLSAKFIHLPSERLDDEIELALKKVLEFFQVDRCGLLRVLPHKNAWKITHVAYSEHGKPVPKDTELPRSINPWGYERLAVKGKVVSFARVDDAPDEAHVDKQTWIDWGIRSNLAIPILTGESVVHIIAINAIQRERVWPEEFIPRLQLLGEIFVSALERRMADQTLRQNSARLNLAADSAEAGLWELDCSTNLFWTSERDRELFGYGPDEVISMERFEKSVHPDDLELVRKVIARALAEGEGERIYVEYRILMGDGCLKWISSCGRPYFKPNGEPDRLMGVSLDISERKQMEDELNERLKEIEAGNKKGISWEHVKRELEKKWGPFDAEEYRKQVDEERLEKERIHNEAFIGTPTLSELIKKMYSDYKEYIQRDRTENPWKYSAKDA